MELLIELLIGLIILVFSAILHEIAHGLVADYLGDPTARLMGRLTLDPRKHIDPTMTFLVPAMLYILSNGSFVLGGAKPVPVDPFNLKEGRKDVALVSLAGPLTNIILAVGAGALMKLLILMHGSTSPVYEILDTVVDINIKLGVFNLIPIPPLDGSKVFSLILPEETANSYLRIGNMGLVLLLLLLNMGIFGGLLSGVTTALRGIILP